MQKQYSEPEETTGEENNETFDPAEEVSETVTDVNMLTEENVIDRSHASASQTGEAAPEWNPPPSFTDDQVHDDKSEKDKGKGEQQEYVNPEMEDLPDELKEEGAGYMADMCLEVYGEGKRELGNLFIPIKKRRITRLDEEGLIDLSMTLRLRNNTTSTVQEVIDRYNSKATDVFKLRPKFVEEVRPILVKEFSKKGIGLTPMQRVCVSVALDLKEDMKIAVQLKGEADNIIDALKEATAAWQQYSSTQGQQHTPNPAHTSSPSQEPGSTGQQNSDNGHVNNHDQGHQTDPLDQSAAREQSLASEFERIQQENQGSSGPAFIPSPGKSRNAQKKRKTTKRKSSKKSSAL